MNIEKTRVIWLGSMKGSELKYCQDLNLNWDQGHFTNLGVKFSINLNEIIDINFTQKIREIKNLLLQWSKRNLTPIGKITVLKTLALSKINHLFLALPNPPAHILKEINTLFFNFVWNGSKDRIKRKILIQDYNLGGLRMINVNYFSEALKITWLRRLLNAEDSKWTNILTTQWKECKDFYKFGTDFISTNLHNLNPFWCDVFKSWIDFLKRYNVVHGVFDFLTQPIWFNPNITIGGHSVFMKSLFEKGIWNINDLLNEQDNFFSYEELREMFNLNINFLEYNGLVAAIKRYKYTFALPEIFKRLFTPIWPPNIKILLKDKKGCKIFYKFLIKNQETITAKTKWDLEFGPIESVTLRNIFGLPYTITSSTSMRWLQVRILHRILSTNTFLYKINLTDTNKCSFCNNNPERLTHLFWHCNVINTFWNDISHWL